MASLTEAAGVQGKGVDAGGRLPGFESSSQHETALISGWLFNVSVPQLYVK